MGYFINFGRDRFQKELKKWLEVKRRMSIQSVDRPEIEFKVSCDVMKSADFAEFRDSMMAPATFKSISGRSADPTKVRLLTIFFIFYALSDYAN